jgi:SNW domain-containing protein 1
LKNLAKLARDKRSGITGASPDKDRDAEKEVRERDQIRKERHDQRTRERNIARAAPGKQKELRAMEDRDISEQVALGLPAKKSGGDALFDQRLFGQSKGMDTGFEHGNDEAYNIYDKPWRSENTLSNHLYRPPKNRDGELYGDDIEEIAKQKRFVPDRGFEGAEGSAPRGSGPVQFEKDQEDVFGLDKLLADVKAGSKRSGDKEDKSSKRRR